MSLFSRLNPVNIVPQFPPYTGPYAVGSFEVEIPVASLAPPGSTSGVAETVQFRVFYPTQKPVEKSAPAGCRWGRGDKKQNSTHEEQPPESFNPNSKPVRWLPEPHQREYLSAYARFLGASSGFAEIVSYGGRLLHYISLPVIADAPLLPKPSAPRASSAGWAGNKTTSDHRFPTMIFSHGLGGTRLAYSHICCSIASYGVVVVAPEHRDGSAPVSFVKPPSSPETQLPGTKPSSDEPGIVGASTAPKKDTNGRSQVDYVTYPHHVSDGTANGRNRQLGIRHREIMLIYTALSKLDGGIFPDHTITSTDEIPGDTGKKLLATFKDRLDIRTPGRVIWAGHSFGASTMFQFVKTIYHTPPPEFSSESEFSPLFTPESTLPDSALPLKQQVTADSPLMLLDLWCLPLLGKRTSYLFKQPLPQVAEGKGRNILVVMSEEFWKWKENLNGVRRVLSSDPGRKRGGAAHKWFEQWDEEHERVLSHSAASKHQAPMSPAPMASLESPQLEVGGQIIPPDGTTPVPTRPSSSAGKSDPRFFYATKSAHLSQSDFGILFPKAIRKAEEPERILELNVRAAVQWLRESGFSGVLGQSEKVMEGEGLEEQMEGLNMGESTRGGAKEDELIFEGEVEGWARIGLEEVEKVEQEVAEKGML